jgi:hypothetical protein
VEIPGPEIVARYTRVRAVSKALNNRLVESLSRDVLDEGGKKLGILKGDTLVLSGEDEIAVLMDFCIYNVFRDGKNAVERFLETSPPPAGSEEMRILEGMRGAWYSLVSVQKSVPGTGVAVLDVLRQREHFIVDLSMSQTVPFGAVMGTRLIPLADFTMTGGAALPVPDREALNFVVKRVTGLMKRLNVNDFSWLTAEQSTQLTATIIRACLERGAAERIAYADPGERLPPRPRAPAGRLAGPVERVGRNDPCPCGSGKKFKKCCGGRQ